MASILDRLSVRLNISPACPDPVFNARAARGLVWLPERGIGWLPVSDQPYDTDYFRKYEGYAATEMGAAITRVRVELVERYLMPARPLIDVGIGSGAFLDELLASGFTRAYGFDINPAGVDWLGGRSLFMDPYTHPADALTFWDSLEHIPDVHRMLGNARRFVFCSLPIVPGDGPPRLDWKHLRRDEHCWYFTRRGLIGWMDEQGFDCVECTAAETLVGREDVETLVFRRREC